MKNDMGKGGSLPFRVWFSRAGVSSLRPWVLSSLRAGFGNLSHSAEDLWG